MGGTPLPLEEVKTVRNTDFPCVIITASEIADAKEEATCNVGDLDIFFSVKQEEDSQAYCHCVSCSK